MRPSAGREWDQIIGLPGGKGVTDRQTDKLILFDQNNTDTFIH